jgi:hypothetical protein
MLDRDWICLQYGNITTKLCEQQKTGTGNRLLNEKTTSVGIRNVYCAQKQNTFQTVHIKHYLQITKRQLRTDLSELYM